MKKYFAEFIGTCALVLIGCGSAVISVNPAGSLGPVIFSGGIALSQL